MTRVEIPHRAEARQDTLPEITYDPQKTTHEEVWGIIEEKYGQTPYEQMISRYVDQIMPNAEGGHRTALTRLSVTRYMEFYTHIRGEFMTTAQGLQEKFEWAKRNIQEEAHDELSILRSALEGASALSSMPENVPAPENREAVTRYFGNYLNALNGRYFNEHANEGIMIPGSGIPILDPFIHADGKVFDRRAHPEESVAVPIIGPVVGSDVFKGKNYRAKSEDFQRKMEKWVDDKLAYLLAQHATQADLQAFAGEIGERYSLYSRIDAHGDVISLADLEVLSQASNPPFNALQRMMNESDTAVIRRLEVVHLMNRDGWDEVVDLAGATIINQAISNGSEANFVAEVNKLRKAKGLPKVNDFDDAKDEFKEMLETISAVGVKETLAFVRKFNGELHGDVVNFEEEVEPELFRPLVRTQMDQLLNGLLVPTKEIDRMLVSFISGNRETRNEILQNEGSREVLLRAIATATVHYPELFEQNFRNLPTDLDRNGRSPYRTSPRIRKPSHHDQAAQLQALIILGKQAEVIVKKLEHAPENRALGISAELARSTEALPEEPQGTQLGLRFEPPGPRHLAYTSALQRGGFNTRDFALKGAKIFGALTVMANVAQAWSIAGQGDAEFLDRVMNTVELSITNPAAIAGAAVTVGSHMAERNKAFLRYPWLSQHDRAEAMAVFKLDNIGARVGHDEMRRFTHNNAEYRALDHPDMTADQIRELMQNAAKRAKDGAKPMITIEDMRSVIHDTSITATLTSGGRSNRMRYLFYQKFIAGRSKPNISQIKELCTGSSHISSSPVNLQA